jgi:hypothetical protein
MKTSQSAPTAGASGSAPVPPRAGAGVASGTSADTPMSAEEAAAPGRDTIIIDDDSAPDTEGPKHYHHQ